MVLDIRTVARGLGVDWPARDTHDALRVWCAYLPLAIAHGDDKEVRAALGRIASEWDALMWDRAGRPRPERPQKAPMSRPRRPAARRARRGGERQVANEATVTHS